MREDMLIMLIGNDISMKGNDNAKVKMVRARDKEEAIRLLKKKNWLSLESNDNVYVIDKEDIIFAEVDEKNVIIHTKHRKILKTRCGIADFIERANCKGLVRSHKSFALNVNEIEEIKKIASRLWEVHFKGYSESCLMSKFYKMDVLNCLQNLLEE